MTESLPTFRYHPDPVATGMVVTSGIVCICCERARGYIYIGPVYSIEQLNECFCPWCIADGSASKKFDASFADSYPLIQAGLDNEIVEEVHLRTPGYSSWQQESWLSHCNDACEFHGDASVFDVANASPETKSNWIADYEQDDKGWLWVTEGYQPGGDSALYKFKCRNCQLILFGWDLY
jgi:uncharacterized protein